MAVDTYSRLSAQVGRLVRANGSRWGYLRGYRGLDVSVSPRQDKRLAAECGTWIRNHGVSVAVGRVPRAVLACGMPIPIPNTCDPQQELTVVHFVLEAGQSPLAQVAGGGARPYTPPGGQI